MLRVNVPAVLANLRFRLLLAPKQDGQPATDPTVVGKVDAEGVNIEEVTIVIDLTGNGQGDLTVWPDHRGHFQVRPTGIPAGPITFQAQALRWDHMAQVDVYGDWFELSFDYQPPGGPELELLELFNDTGFVGDNVTSDPTLSVSNLRRPAGVARSKPSRRLTNRYGTLRP